MSQLANRLATIRSKALETEMLCCGTIETQKKKQPVSRSEYSSVQPEVSTPQVTDYKENSALSNVLLLFQFSIASSSVLLHHHANIKLFLRQCDMGINQGDFTFAELPPYDKIRRFFHQSLVFS